MLKCKFRKVVCFKIGDLRCEIWDERGSDSYLISNHIMSEKIDTPAKVWEAFKGHLFVPPDWRKVSTAMVFILQIGGCFPPWWFLSSNLEDAFYLFFMVKVAVTRVGNVTDVQAIICRKASMVKIVKCEGERAVGFNYLWIKQSEFT